jgi:hypothetical protein
MKKDFVNERTKIIEDIEQKCKREVELLSRHFQDKLASELDLMKRQVALNVSGSMCRDFYLYLFCRPLL